MKNLPNYCAHKSLTTPNFNCNSPPLLIKRQNSQKFNVISFIHLLTKSITSCSLCFSCSAKLSLTSSWPPGFSDVFSVNAFAAVTGSTVLEAALFWCRTFSDSAILCTAGWEFVVVLTATLSFPAALSSAAFGGSASSIGPESSEIPDSDFFE